MKSRSGDYKLPGPVRRWVGNQLVAIAPYLPLAVRHRFLLRGPYYQVFEPDQLGDQQGLSINKWSALQMPDSLSGKSVLDIGCADGFFCQQCAKHGARSVVGIDTAVGRLLRARFTALDAGLNIDYRIDIFPSQKMTRRFDYVLCLSVLHHSLATKDLWKVLTSPGCAEDLSNLRHQLNALKTMTASDGQCIIETPYEYDDPRERNEVDFGLFTNELLTAGFASAQCLGMWAHNEKLQAAKDRLIYVAHA